MSNIERFLERVGVRLPKRRKSVFLEHASELIELRAMGAKTSLIARYLVDEKGMVLVKSADKDKAVDKEQGDNNHFTAKSLSNWLSTHAKPLKAKRNRVDALAKKGFI